MTPALGMSRVLDSVSDSTILKWRRVFDKGGIDAFRQSPSKAGVRKRCQILEERIVAHRQEHPEHGARRIRDDLRRQDGLETSAETVRTVVNEAGLGAPPVQAKRRPVQVRRFERSIPNALWQIDIFTFKLKRMYPVYLVGIIDDHSRYADRTFERSPSTSTTSRSPSEETVSSPWPI